MTGWMVLPLVLAVWPSADEPKPDLPADFPWTMAARDARPEAVVLRGRALSDEASACLRRWAGAGPSQARQAAADYLRVHDLLVADQSLARSDREVLLQKLRGRLKALLAELNKPPAQGRAEAVEPSPLTVQLTRPTVLGQMAMPGGRGGAGWGMGGWQPWGAAGGQGGLGGPAQADAGNDLAELIQKTIAPSTWNVNGGPGAIYYWSPGRAMVISASRDVHDQLGDLLDQLRRAGP